MRKFLLGLIVGVIITVLGGIIVGFAIARLSASKAPTVEANSVLVLNLEDDIPEVSPVEIPLPFFQAQSTPTVRDLWTSLHEAATDTRIKAVLLKPRGLTIGWAKMEELHQDILDLKKSGKPVYAYLEGPGTREYYVASAADKIYLSPDDMVDVKGLGLETVYLKNGLDKLGINFQVDHIGRYKDAGDMFTRTDMSPETKEVLNQVLDQLYGDFCTTVGQGRRKSSDEMRALVDMGPFMGVQAKANGLVDELGYEDQVYGDLKKKLGVSDLKKSSIKTYFRAVSAGGDRIAFIAAEGDILRGDPDDQFGNNQIIASGKIARTIRQVRNDGTVKGVIVRVDSPGGDAVASDEILHELKLLSEAKPTVISMSDYAASGGYFISMTGSRIVAYPNTLTGSIGVLYARPNLHDLYSKLGINEAILTRGKFADMDSDYVPLSDAAKQKLHESIQMTYQSFVSKVAAARKKTYDQIDPIAQGRVWMGAQASQNGLVDELGGLDQAVALIRQEAKLPPNGETNLVMFPGRRSLFDILMSSSPDDVTSSLANDRIRKLLPSLPSPALLRGGILRLMPYRIEVH
ncbi:MAG TPA: signal peptide peptidase SppA [Bryobacteraceae bacterium]|jgi:protease-4|nr:signal peptide peptidase SppA [Bryobacteraceae bacterium]